MPPQLLPRTAAAFAPRASPNIVMDPKIKVEKWLTENLKRVIQVKRPLHKPEQHRKCLVEIFSNVDAVWSLTTLFVPKAPESELLKDENPLANAVHNYEMIPVEAYVVHIDMVAEQEVVFKLTTDTIDLLVKYHREIWSVDAAANIFDWPEKENQIKKLQQDFVQAANQFVFRTDLHALEGLEEGGFGELLQGRPEQVKTNILSLFAPLTPPPPPPPQMVSMMQPAMYVSHPIQVEGYWTPQPQMLSVRQPSLDTWRVLPSTPSPTVTSCSDPNSQQQWQPLPLSFDVSQLPSPSPSYSQPVFTTTTASLYSSPPAIASIPPTMYPSQLPQGCGSSLSSASYDMYGFGYGNFALPQYAATS